MLTAQLTPQVLFEDDDIIVVNKPPGLVVNRAATVQEETFQDWLAERLAKISPPADWASIIPQDFDETFGQPLEIMAERSGVVHRLDKDTSGVMVAAKHPGALVALLAQFKQRRVSKTYQALCHGKFQILADTVNIPLGRSVHDQLKFGVKADGKAAVTEYKVEAFYPGLDVAKIKDNPQFKGKNLLKKARIYQGFSLVSCQPKTGRTHQIRVHMAHLQHPLVGDSTYAGRKRQATDGIWCPRHFLHASQLTFFHPRSGSPVSFTAPLWPDLHSAMQWLLPAE